MNAYSNLRAAVVGATGSVTVDSVELSDLLTEVFALRAPAPKKAKKAAPAAESCPLPAWLPLDAWNAFLDMRKAIKKPATGHAQALLVKKLAAFYANDLDPGVILNQSIMNNWQDLYAPKEASTAYRGGVGAGAGRPPRGPAPESDQDRDARRSRWGIPDMGGPPDASQ